MYKEHTAQHDMDNMTTLGQAVHLAHFLLCGFLLGWRVPLFHHENVNLTDNYMPICYRLLSWDKFYNKLQTESSHTAISHIIRLQICLFIYVLATFIFLFFVYLPLSRDCSSCMINWKSNRQPAVCSPIMQVLLWSVMGIMCIMCPVILLESAHTQYTNGIWIKHCLDLDKYGQRKYLNEFADYIFFKCCDLPYFLHYSVMFFCPRFLLWFLSSFLFLSPNFSFHSLFLESSHFFAFILFLVDASFFP